MAPGSNGWFRRRVPRLSGTLHIRDADGHTLVVALRGRATLLTADGIGLSGYGEVWAVHTTAPAAATSLMIVYGRDGSTEELTSGLCAAGQTIALDDVTFTWCAPSTPPNGIPRQRPAASRPAGNLRMPPPRATNARSTAATAPIDGLRSRLRNMVRVVTQATRH